MMALFRPTRGLGTLMLAVYLIAAGLTGLVALPMPAIVLPILALLAGILILAGR